MNNKADQRYFKEDFERYLGRVFLKNLTLVLSLGILILTFYIYSDWNVRQNPLAVTTRLLPLSLIVILLITHLISKHKYYKFKSYIYVSIYLALQLMMYGKCLIHLHDDGLAPSVTGTILVIFLISLDIKQSDRLTAFIYAFPITVFSLILIFIHQPSSKEFIVLADIYPIIAVGFIINRMQYRLRFRLFKSNKLLNLERSRTKTLYDETLLANDLLEKKAVESFQIKEEIEKKNQELEKLNQAKDKFLGIIAHDLKNPISTIWGLSDLLMLKNELDEKNKVECIQTINESIKHTHGLLENLLDWARAQSNTIVFKPIHFRPYEKVEKELRLLHQMAEKKSISFKNTIPCGFVMFADENMFETIVRNLISNAIKYTQKNGKIEISAQLIQKESDEKVLLSVADNGIGMNKSQLSGLFRISDNTSTKGTENEAGTGLGLLLCKEFIDIHNGIICVKSKPGEGSVFQCFFPLN
ncbi:sensor histidine kinase [Alkalitalea saponilacus]|nr:HAMP domain-containing sensor histidine kinase [Alkalitalea saponilacus]ASB50570.1 hypothetical protein CDL62_16175 [Alkalitalea saponilacus]